MVSEITPGLTLGFQGYGGGSILHGNLSDTPNMFSYVVFEETVNGDNAYKSALRTASPFIAQFTNRARVSWGDMSAQSRLSKLLTALNDIYFLLAKSGS